MLWPTQSKVVLEQLLKYKYKAQVNKLPFFQIMSSQIVVIVNTVECLLQKTDALIHWCRRGGVGGASAPPKDLIWWKSGQHFLKSGQSLCKFGQNLWKYEKYENIFKALFGKFGQKSFTSPKNLPSPTPMLWLIETSKNSHANYL